MRCSSHLSSCHGLSESKHGAFKSIGVSIDNTSCKGALNPRQSTAEIISDPADLKSMEDVVLHLKEFALATSSYCLPKTHLPGIQIHKEKIELW